MTTLRETDRYALIRDNLMGVYRVVDLITGDLSLWLSGIDGADQVEDAMGMSDFDFEIWAEGEIEKSAIAA